MLKYIKFSYTRANFNHIYIYNDDIRSHSNVTFYHLSNETNPRFVHKPFWSYKQKKFKKF